MIKSGITKYSCLFTVTSILFSLNSCDTANQSAVRDDLVDLALKPIKPIFDELDLKDEFPHLQESIKDKIRKEEGKPQSLLHHIKYFYDKVNNVYEMVKNPERITHETKTLIEKILQQVRPWFDKNNFDDKTLTEMFNLDEEELEDYHEMYGSLKILLGMIERMLKKLKTS